MADLSRTFDEIFRRDKGRVVAALVRQLGSLDAAEEAFQEAVLAAVTSWGAKDIPTNPAAWLTTVAKNSARDAARHNAVHTKVAPLLAPDEFARPDRLEPIGDDELRLLFTCCHPLLTLDSQVALTLKVVLGFTTEEIARAFLSPEKTITQRIARAKRTIEEERVPYEVPEELSARLASVLAVVYLLYNEGHAPREGAVVRPELQNAAFRLCRLLGDLLPNEPEVFGLLALIAFGIARTETRANSNGEPVLLADQDRSRWDRETIEEGLVALHRARRLGDGSYVLQAEIAACHVLAPTWEATDWSRILRLYDALLALADSPVVALNRAVAVSMGDGPAAALDALAPLESPLASYHLFYAIRGDLRARMGEDANNDYRRALELATNESDRTALRKKIDPEFR